MLQSSVQFELSRNCVKQSYKITNIVYQGDVKNIEKCFPRMFSDLC